MKEIQISNDQARLFASVIFSDIKKYVEGHRIEYEEFLRSEGKPSGNAETSLLSSI